MEEIKNQRTEYQKANIPNINKLIFGGISNINPDKSIKKNEHQIHVDIDNNIKKIKKILNRKTITSAPFIKRYNIDKFKHYNYNSDKKIQVHNNNRNKLKFISVINISTPFNKNNALYKNLKSEIFHKNFGKTPKNLNSNLYKNITTNYLNQKESDKIPILYPFYSSFNNKYESKSQRERYIKNLDKLVQVQTHLNSNKTDHYKIISEFMLKNGIKEGKYLNAENLNKVENYLNKRINFNPNLTMKQIIKNIINNKSNNTSKNLHNQKEDLKTLNYLQLQNEIIQKNSNFKNDIKILKKSNSSPEFNLSLYKDDSRIIKLSKKFSYLCDKKNLNIIVNNLENELKKIKTDKINKLEGQNKLNDKTIYLMKKYEDNNKFVPNLCLCSQGFSERYKNNINKFNNKIKGIISKAEKIKNINKRMYYDSKINKKLKEFDLNDIKKSHKITELVVLSRGKQELLNRKLGKIDSEKNTK